MGYSWALSERSVIDRFLFTYFSNQFSCVMGYSWALSDRSVIECQYWWYWLLKINWINWNILIVYLLMTWWDILSKRHWYLYDLFFFFGLQWYWRPRSCNLGINMIVDSKQVPLFFFFLMTLDALIKDFLFLTVSFFIHLILDFFFGLNAKLVVVCFSFFLIK